MFTICTICSRSLDQVESFLSELPYETGQHNLDIQYHQGYRGRKNISDRIWIWAIPTQIENAGLKSILVRDDLNNTEGQTKSTPVGKGYLT